MTEPRDARITEPTRWMAYRGHSNILSPCLSHQHVEKESKREVPVCFAGWVDWIYQLLYSGRSSILGLGCDDEDAIFIACLQHWREATDQGSAKDDAQFMYRNVDRVNVELALGHLKGTYKGWA